MALHSRESCPLQQAHLPILKERVCPCLQQQLCGAHSVAYHCLMKGGGGARRSCMVHIGSKAQQLHSRKVRVIEEQCCKDAMSAQLQKRSSSQAGRWGSQC